MYSSPAGYTPGVCIGKCQKYISDWPVQYPHYMVADPSLFSYNIDLTTLAVLCKADYDDLSPQDQVRWREIKHP